MKKIEKSAVLEPLFFMLQHLQISEETRQHIGDQLEVLQLKSNSVLLMPGKTCTHVYFVVSGGFVCRYFNENLEIPKTINFYLDDLHPFMACVDSYFTQQPSNCELRAVRESVVLSISKKNLEALVKSNPILQDFYNSLVIQALVEENELKLKIIAHNAEQLYQYLLDELPAVIQKVPSKYIAEFMGISAEWLSKVKKRRR
ncbi:MAG: Crp/Fnr family transcriptional regulator [Saprospiraceae bacterium]|nr:Crp/Fnr family transcriptional regulator [Saprospiraceae bacterium]